MDATLGTCVSAQSTPNEVVLDGSVITPVEGSNEGGTPGYTGPDSSSPANACVYVVADRCLVPSSHGAGPAPQPITLADIAAFRPQPGVDRMQPDGWAVIGLDTNFFAEAPVQVVDGTLLGLPASVRFTPVEYTWSYGDGAGRESQTGGSAWVREFDPTPTSHVYSTSGSYVVGLTISYAAEYQFAGTPWLPITGTLELPTAPLTVTVGDAKTVLVARDCAQNPRGPGC